MRRVLAIIGIASLVAVSGCSSRGSGGGSDTTVPADGISLTSFGDMESPCGKGEATVDATQNGGPTLKITAATDKGFVTSPGLDIELEDAAKAFIGWCNEQGGILGVPLELVEVDAELFKVPAAIEKICSSVFAMVGGGLVFDDKEFPRFNECKMIDFAGYTVTPTKAESSGMVQPIPNPAFTKPAGWFLWAKNTHPEDIKKVAILAGNFVTTLNVAKQNKATMETIEGYGTPEIIQYNSSGEVNWTPFAQQLKDGGFTMLNFVGSPNGIVGLLKAMEEIGYKPNVFVNDGSMYDSMLEGLGAGSEGLTARTVFTPWTDASVNPAMSQFLKIMEKYNPSGKIAGLALQSFSAHLLFATAVKNCAASNDNVIERECVLAEGKKITAWTAGGLHAETNPGQNIPSKCETLMQLQGGKWVRLYPERGSADDSGNGFHCYDDGIVQITGDFGDATAGKDPSRP